MACFEVHKQVNLQAASDYLVYGLSDHAEETFFSKIFQLPASHSLILKPQEKIIIKRYWDIKPNIEKDLFRCVLPQEEEKFNNILSDSVRIRMRSDVPLGSCLSGGLDSTTIVVLLNEWYEKTGNNNHLSLLKTYSACYDDPRYDERNYIEKVIASTKATPTYVYPNCDGFYHDLKKLIWHQEFPIQSTSPYAQYSVMQAARQDGTIVLLDGQAADEILAGYFGFFGLFSSSLLMKGNLKKWLSEYRKSPTIPILLN